MGRVIQGEAVVTGRAAGELLISQEPLSFWGGYDQHTGEIIDRRHPLSGEIAAGKVLAVPFTRGSSTTTAVLLEALKVGNAPAALVSTGTDSFFALASIVADEMYARPIPVISITPAEFQTLEPGTFLQIFEDGRIELEA
jgi:predicted aconitase with swiveling domain